MTNMAKSYVCGISDTPLVYQTIGAALDDVARRSGERTALIVRHQNVRLTYRELAEKAEQLAAGLLAIGIRPGDRVGIWSPNKAEWVIAQFATAKAGMILVTINPAYRRAELEYAVNKVGCKALILADKFKNSDYIEMTRSLAPETEHCAPGALAAKRLPSLKSLIVIGEGSAKGFYRFADILSLASPDRRAELRRISEILSPDDPINIQFTSGTTGFPKGATLTHHNILNNGRFVAARQRFTEADKLCIPVPLYHCFGMVMGVLGCVTHGAAMIFPDEAFDPLSVLKAVAEERCTALYGVPTMFIAELSHPAFSSFDLSSLRTGVMAGAPCPVDIMRRVIAEMHMREVTICYGMTETSPVSFQSMPDDDLEKRVSTVGRIHPFVEVKIVDDSGVICPREVQGELLTRGYSVMRGYWADDEKTREAIDDGGWMHTGDLAVMDKDGYCRITGRVKDMIIRGGENIYPREIEEFLYRHPKVEDVQVFGVPDKKYGEEICAWIRLEAGAAISEDEIKSFCKGEIAHYKIPRYIRFVEEYPMTVTGKVQKFVMREMMADELSAAKQESTVQGGRTFKGDKAMSDCKMLINGKLVEGDRELKVINPATEEVYAVVARASTEQAGEAIAAAKAAFPAWSKTPIKERQAIVTAIADAIRDNAEDLARTLTAEQGKPLAEAHGEVAWAEGYLRHYATLEPEMKVVQDDDTARVEVHRAPLGVIVGIVAWNFPLLLAVWKIGPALIAGNTIVVKPAPTTPATTLKFGALIKDIAPPGVVNIIADENDLGPYLTSHPDVAKVSFTGSVETGRKIMKSGADTLKRLTLELGGNDVAIVLDDVDVKAVAPKIFDAAFLNCGQVCMAAKRIYVHDSIYDEMADALASIAEDAVVDDGSKQGTRIGPLQNRAQFEKVRGFIEDAQKSGATVIGGETPDRPGYFVRPTIVRDVAEGCRIVDEEQFGPVLPLIRFSDDEDVVKRANATEFGLGGSVWSSNFERARKIADQLEAGTVWINQHITIGPHIPMAGAKQSGIGVEQAAEGLAEFTQVKVFNMAK